LTLTQRQPAMLAVMSIPPAHGLVEQPAIAVHGPESLVDRLARQGAGGTAAQTSGYSLFDEHPIARVGGDVGE